MANQYRSKKRGSLVPAWSNVVGSTWCSVSSSGLSIRPPSGLEHDADRAGLAIGRHAERLGGVLEREPVRDQRARDLGLGGGERGGDVDVAGVPVVAVAEGGHRPQLARQGGDAGQGQVAVVQRE